MWCPGCGVGSDEQWCPGCGLKLREEMELAETSAALAAESMTMTPLSIEYWTGPLEEDLLDLKRLPLMPRGGVAA